MADITLESLARQLDRMLDRIGTMGDHMTVLTGMVMRIDGSVAGLTVEMRGLSRLLDRFDQRVTKLEDADG